ncbi:MAG: DGQHR domain-containing protein [Gammaproteobacteria bacterium]|nr:DGQHR domain-containing protein [Gammaproteobacteria bacterium]
MNTHKIEFDAIKVSQPIGEFYCGVMNAPDLVAISEADVRRLESNDLDNYLGIQRPLKPNRVKQINSYIRHIDATFPNSIIVAIKAEYVTWDETRKTLTIDCGANDKERVALILDGQHRLAGFDSSNSRFKSTGGEECIFQLLVTIFVEADISTQAGIFATVNLAQTKVNKSLVYDLESLAAARSPERTCHDIAVLFNSDESGPLYRSIKRLGVATSGIKGEFLTQAAFVENLVKLISPDPTSDKNILLSNSRSRFLGKNKDLGYLDSESLSKYFFRKAFIEKKDEVIAANLSNYFTAVQRKWPEAWNKNDKKSSLNKTIGFNALMRIFRDVYLSLATPPSNWSKVFSTNDYYSVISTSNVSSNYFFELDPTTKSAGAIYKAIKESIALAPTESL